MSLRVTGGERFVNGSRRHASSSIGAIADPRPRIGDWRQRSLRGVECRHAQPMPLRCCPGLRRRDHRDARTVIGSSDPSSAPRSEVATARRRRNASQFVPPRSVRRCERLRRGDRLDRAAPAVQAEGLLVPDGGCRQLGEGSGWAKWPRLNRRGRKVTTGAASNARSSYGPIPSSRC